AGAGVPGGAGLRGAGPRRPGRGGRGREGLVGAPAGGAVAPAGRAGLVVVRGPGRPLLHPGAARRRGGRRLLPPAHRPAGLDAPRRGPVLGVHRRRRAPRPPPPPPRPPPPPP